jgi:hypothetical protein
MTNRYDSPGSAARGSLPSRNTGQILQPDPRALTSDNPNGTVQTYAGTDTVTGGRIIHVSVTQTG